MDTVGKDNIRSAYQLFLQQQTLWIIKVSSGLGIMMYALFAWVDISSFGETGMFKWRLIGTLPLVVSLGMVWVGFFDKSPRWILPVHALNIVFFLVHEVGLIHVYWGTTLPGSELSANPITIMAFVIALALSFLAAGGVLRYVPYFHILTMLAVFWVLRGKMAMSEGEWTYFLNVLFLVFVMIGVSVVYEKMRFKGFSSRYELQEQRFQLVQKEKALEIDQLKEQTAQWELQALRTQINPHFTFNVLNSIQSCYLLGDRERFLDSMAQFSRLMRLVLEASRQQSISLKNELKILQDYLDLEALCYQGRFQYNLKGPNGIDPEAYQVPPLLIQPFVENALKHGVLNTHKVGTIKVSFMTSSKHLICTVEDDGVGREVSASIQHERNRSEMEESYRSQGIKIIEERLDILGKQYGEPFPMEIQDLIDDTGKVCGTRVVLRVPHIYTSPKLCFEEKKG